MKISIALGTYNGERYLQAQLDSIQSQSVPPDELVISDDHSTDTTWAIATAFANGAPFPVKLVRAETNGGVLVNFERALSNVTGDVIFLCDQDDVWPVHKIETVLQAFRSETNVSMFFSNADVVSDNLLLDVNGLWHHIGFDDQQIQTFLNDPFAFLLTGRNVVTGAAAAFSKTTVEAALPFPSQMAIGHDGWLALVASAIGTTYLSKERLLSYRQHDAQQVGIKKKTPNFGLSDYQRQLQQLAELRTRLAPVLSESHAALVDAYVTHLKLRTNLSPNPLRRVAQVSSELMTGRYTRFSSGIKSAAKDLLA